MAIKATATQLLKDNVEYPAARISQAATITALKAVTGMTNEEVRMVPGSGVFRYDSSATDTANDVDIVEPTSGGGRWILDGANLAAAGTLELANYADVAAMIAASGSDENTLIVRPGTHNVAASVTFPAESALEVKNGSKIKPASGQTVTINSKITAGPYQIFDESAGGTVTLGADAATEVYSEWWGATGDGTTDDSVAVRRALANVANGGTARFLAGSTYVVQTDQPDPYSGSGQSVGYAFESKTGIRILAHDATFKATNAVNSVFGLFTFYNCTDCSIVGARYEGAYTAGVSWSAALACIMGNSTGCRVEGVAKGGYGLAVIRATKLDGTDTDATMPKNTIVKGYAYSCRYGVLYSDAGYGHHLDINTYDVLRSAFLQNTSGVHGSVVSRLPRSNDLYFAGYRSGTMESINIDYHVDGNNASALCAFSIGDSTACTFKNITVTGAIKQAGSSRGVYLVIDAYTGTVLENIDFGGLSIDVSGANQGFQVELGAATTIKGLVMPKRIVTTTGTPCDIDGTNGTLSHFVIPDGFYYECDAGASTPNVIQSVNGTVTDFYIGYGTIVAVTSNGVGGFSITNADGLFFNGPRVTNSKGIYIVGSTNVSPHSHIDSQGRGRTLYQGLSNGDKYSGIQRHIVTSGSATITSLQRVIPGQVIHFVFQGGTQTFSDGANMLLAGGFGPATAGDTLTLICVDDPGSGPQSTSTMAEVSRSVN